jgi:SAM-dependent methyltransferase
MAEEMRALVRRGYDRGAYDREFRARDALTPLEARFLARLSDGLPAGARILDLGSGTGVPYDRHLAAQGYALTGVDFSAKHVALARANVPAAAYVQGDFSAVTFPAESFDAVVSFYAVFHLPREEHAGLFRRIAGWLKPGGLLLATLGAGDMPYDEDEFAGARMAWSSYAPTAYLRLLAESGLALRWAEFEGRPGDEEHHFWLLAQKGA